MKKINNKGFILAETLIVSVFLMVIFSMIYSNFYPLIGEYEKRENYDDVDGKYTAYWIKKMIESSDYQLSRDDYRMLNQVGYTRFGCGNFHSSENKDFCKNIVKSLGISRCNNYGNLCDIYITRYKIFDSSGSPPSIKNAVRGDLAGQNGQEMLRNHEINAKNKRSIFNNSSYVSDMNGSFQQCMNAEGQLRGFTSSSFTGTITNKSQINSSYNNYSALYNYAGGAKTNETNSIARYCHDRLTQKAFLSATKDYILSLPNYTYAHTSTGARFRVIVVVHHTKDSNNFYSFSTMEVIR